MATEGGVMTAELKQSADTGAPASSWKPYPAYKDSGVEWLGKVPEHWEVSSPVSTLIRASCSRKLKDIYCITYNTS